MKLTDFEDQAEIKLKNDGMIYKVHHSSNIESGFLTIGDNIHPITNFKLMCRDDWELVEKPYTTREALKMLADGKTMVTEWGGRYKFNEYGELYYQDNSPATLSEETLKGKWTEYKGAN